MNLFKRFTALLLAVLLVTGLFPVHASADEQEPLTFETNYINPLYADIVTEEDIPPVVTQRVQTYETVKYATTVEEAGIVLREQMKARMEAPVVHIFANISATQEEFNALCRDLYEVVITHTQEPDEGDYILWHLSGYTASGTLAPVDGGYNIDITYSVEYHSNTEQEAAVDAAVEELLSQLNLSGKSDYEKVKAVYDYICENVRYDKTSSGTLKHTAYAALINKTAVCQGYASLLYRLLLELDVDTRVISGIGNGGAHGWNIVELDNRYYNADSTWDEGQTSYSWFLRSPANFPDHVRDTEYDTAAFNSAYPMASADYAPHTHSYTAVVTKPTCTNKGYTTYICTCGDSYVSDYADVIGHSFVNGACSECGIYGGKCGDNLEWILDTEGHLTISGRGQMTDDPWSTYKDVIKTVTIENGVTNIRYDAFHYCYNLESVTIPESVTSIGSEAFSECDNLTSVTIPGSVTSIDFGSFEYCDNLCSVTIEEGVTGIGERAFGCCDKLSSITLPQSLTYIDDAAFATCYSLDSITIPANVTSFGVLVFAECTGLKTTTFEGNGCKLHENFFQNVHATAYYPAGNDTWTSEVMQQYGGKITWVPYGDVHEHTEVIDAAVEPTCTETGLTEGKHCSECGEILIAQEEIPALGHSYENGICTVCGEADPNYSTAVKIASGWSGDLTWVLTDDGVLAFSGTGAMKNYGYKSEMPWYKYIDQITSVVLNEGVTRIGDYAFYGMTKLETIDIADTVTYIGDFSFKGSTALDGVVLPPNLSNLGTSSFYGCTGLTSIEIPASLYTVKPYAFKNCSSLAKVTFHEGNLMKLSDGSFYGTALTELEFPKCLDIIDVYCFKNCFQLATITIPEGDLTQIREAVFYATAIPSITIPEGVTKVGPYAFKNCVNLKTVSLPTTLTSVGEASFYACTGLQGITIPDAVTSIGDYAFRKCAAMTEVNLGRELTDIGLCAFYGCSGLTNLEIPDKVTTIQGYAFKGCTGLTDVTLGSSVETLGESAFHTCTALKTLELPASLKTIGDYCFSGSYNLWKLTFNGNAPSIGSGAFKSMAATAYYPANDSTWTSDVMQNYGGSITWKAAD